uniref:reverse transcriptase family protein n=1 Tax=Marisediminicola senii TaxID=2711233 RepID=UPI0013E9A48F
MIRGHTPHSSTADVASALAGAFLAADAWTERDLVAAGAHVLGARRRWLPPLVRETLAAYRRPPVDAPRELGDFVEMTAAFGLAVVAAHDRRTPIRIEHRVLVAARAVPATPAVPRVDGLDDLADLLGLTPGELDWFADRRHYTRRATDTRLQHYRHEWRTRPQRTPRLLEVPGSRLVAVQRTVLAELLGPLPVHGAAHGFVPGRSAITGAARHTGAAVVIALDLSTFFSRVTAGRVYATLRRAGYPEAVAHAITGLCTHAVPPRVIAAMPSGGDADERFAARRALAAAHLPQGAPTSPMLANLSVRRLDARLSAWAERVDATYTRYADDLAFSGPPALARRSDAFIGGGERIVTAEGHPPNARKTPGRPARPPPRGPGNAGTDPPHTPRTG